MENSEMRVGAVTAVKEAQILTIPLPEIHDDEVLVRIHTCALCTFEQRIFTGEKKVPLPNVGGHEVAGSIAKVGKSVDSKWKTGLKVALRTFTRCNECHYCHTGEDTMLIIISKFLELKVLEVYQIILFASLVYYFR